jgi:peptidoglycan glycosyltransferase
MKKLQSHQRNDDKEVEILDFNDNRRKNRKYTSSRSNTKAKKGNRNKEFAIVTYVFLALFLCMTGYFLYFVGFESEDFINNPYNARLATMADQVVRGDILSSDGTILATTNVDDWGNETRSYPYGRVFAHAVGYADNGMAGVELSANYNLLRSNSFILTRIANEIADKKNQGDDVVTTLDLSLQQTCYDALGSYDGAIICIEPETGKVLAMVSKPDYDPNYITENWDSYVSEDSDSTVLLNRATQGLYAPGSTFKILTLFSYLQQNQGDGGFQFECTGSYTYQDYEMHCYNSNAHGTENLFDAFGNSCNSAFSSIGLTLNIKQYNKLCEQLLFNKTLPTRLGNTAVSRMTLAEDSDAALIMQTAIGQGETMVSPLHMAMLAAAIANDGKLMEPYMIDSIQNDSGMVVKQYSSSTSGQLMTAADAATLQEYMRYVVTNGTGSALQSDTYDAYGKTGTAEFSSNKNEDHSWFVGFARNAEGKSIAVAVVMEGVSSGSSYAVPATRKIFDNYFSR